MQGKPSPCTGCFLLAWLSPNDSLQKSRWQFMRFWRFCSRTRNLCKSGDDTGPGRPLLGYMFCFLVQGFCWNVAMTGILDDRCSDAFSVLAHKDCLEKSRSKFSSKPTVLSSALKQLLLFPEECYTLSKMSHASIKVMVANPNKH